jgi:cytochrome c5
MRIHMAGALSAACLALALSNCATPHEPPIQEGAPVPDTTGRVINLAQNWSEQQQQWFWFTSQGSRLLPYDWYLALEQAGSNELFRSDAHMDRLRFLLEKPSAANPDGLPVGFAKDTDAQGGAWVGLTCSACHTGQVNYKGTMMRIDGAPTLADHFRFSDELVAALQATAADDAKFERFARKVLGQGSTPESAQKLREELRGTVDALGTRQRVDRPEHPYGYARLDAFGAIFNQVLGADINVPENYLPANAPVSFPFLWDTPQSDLVQWNGSAPNGEAGFGPLARNVGEILGVFGTVSIQPGNGLKGYPSSARVVSLGELEKSLDDLWSPQWPAEVLPAIDAAKAAQGQAIYQQQCAKCHALIDRTSPKRRITAVMTPVTELGTDPTMADNFVNRTGKTGLLQGHKVLLVAGQTFGEEATGFEILENAAIGTILGQKAHAIEAGLEDYLKVRSARTFDPRSYKARPLNGIWATAPYLHNGSVPNLWQLLQPADKRVKEFYVGSREVDPVNVGLDTAPYPGGFKFDTTLPSNSNAGHTYGTTLTDDQKWALIEYIKTL